MTDTLLNAVRRYAEVHSDSMGVAQTPIPELTVHRAIVPSELQPAIFSPLVCLVLQGTKQVTVGNQTYTHSAGDSLLATADIPTVASITQASGTAPYLSIAVTLDPVVITELMVDMEAAPAGGSEPVRIERTDAEVAEILLRMMRLIEDHPGSVPILHAQLVRELHYWLLSGRHGATIRRFGYPESHAQRVARAVAVIRAEFAQPLSVERLANVAGMSPSSFHQHFRAVTTLSPLQFQKQLRLIEARRQMLTEGISASRAAYLVGYESVPQFSREYARMFGLPPVREIKAVRSNEEVAA